MEEIKFRPVNLADAAGMAALHAERAERDGVDSISTLEGIPGAAQILERLEQAASRDGLEFWLVAESGGRIIGYSQPGLWRERDGRWVYLIQGWVLPQCRGQGIGSEMLRRMETQGRGRMETEFPGALAEFAANASSTERESTALLLDFGYKVAYTVLEMELDPEAVIQESPLAEGLEIRLVLPDHLRPIAECVGLCYQDEYDQGRFADEYDPAWYAQRLNEPDQDPGLWQVAWAGEQVVGQVLSIIERGRAEVFEVSVRPAWRRKGLARALLTRALGKLRQRDVPVVRLHTVSEFKTRARDLYHDLGFRVLKEFPRYRKPMT